MRKEKILICYNEPASIYENYLGKSSAKPEEKVDLSEKDFLNQISNIKKTLKKEFESVNILSIGKDIPQVITKLKKFSPDIIFNFVEAVDGNSNYESYLAGIFELLQLEYTGNKALTLGNCLNKTRTKQVLQSFGIRTPNYQLIHFKKKIDEKEFKLNFPVILKLTREDASIGISEFSVAYDFKSMNKHLNFLLENFKQDVLIEEYIKGREINAAILGNKLLPLSEITFKNLPDDLPKIVTYEAKWSAGSVYYKNTIPVCPAKVDEKTRKKIERMALDAYYAMDCRDYVRVDFRLSKNNTPYVIEVNPNPDISPDSGFVRSAAAAGITYEELLYTLAEYAIKRNGDDNRTAFETQEAVANSY